MLGSSNDDRPRMNITTLATACDYLAEMLVHAGPLGEPSLLPNLVKGKLKGNHRAAEVINSRKSKLL